MAPFSDDLLSGDDFKGYVALAIFYCYDYGANAPEAVEKITANEKDCTNAPCVLYSLLRNHNISSLTVVKRLVSRTLPA